MGHNRDGSVWENKKTPQTILGPGACQYFVAFGERLGTSSGPATQAGKKEKPPIGDGGQGHVIIVS